MRKVRTAKPHPHTIKQAINLIFDLKKKENETAKQKPLVRYLGRIRDGYNDWADHLVN